MDSYVASNGSCFMVTWTRFKNHLLEVGLTRNRETMALQMLIIVGLFYFIMWGPTSIGIHWYSIWLRARSHMTSHYIWGFATTLCDFGGILGWPWTLSFWAATISWSRLLVCVERPIRSRPPYHMHNLCQLISLLQHNIKLWSSQKCHGWYPT